MASLSFGHPTPTDYHRPTQLTQTRRSTQELLQQHEEVADGWLLEHVGAFFVKLGMGLNIRLTNINLAHL